MKIFMGVTQRGWEIHVYIYESDQVGGYFVGLTFTG
jgi:hypothetical protein